MVVTTKETWDTDYKDESGIIHPRAGQLKMYQKVVAVGTTVKNIQVGDTVWIDPKRYAVYVQEPDSIKDSTIQHKAVKYYNFDEIEIDGKDCLMLYDNDIKFIMTDFEETADEVVDKPDIIKPDNNIIWPNSSKIITDI